MTGVYWVPVSVDFHVGRTAQRDIDLLLAELVGGRITGSLRRMVMLRIGGGLRRHIDDRHPERCHAQLSAYTAKREPRQEPLDRLKIVDPRIRDVSRVEREAALIQRGTQGVYRRRPDAVSLRRSDSETRVSCSSRV